MARRAKPEGTVAELTEAEVRLSRDESVGKAVKSIGVREAIAIVDPLTPRVSPTATNLMDARALPMLANAQGVGSRDGTSRPTLSIWP
jgi:hypothetical protein